MTLWVDRHGVSNVISGNVSAGVLTASPPELEGVHMNQLHDDALVDLNFLKRHLSLYGPSG